MRVHNRICKNCKYNKDCTDVVEFNYCKRKQEVDQNIAQFYRDFHDTQRSVDMKITMYELLGMVKDGKAPKRIRIRSASGVYEKEFYFDGNIYMYKDEYGDDYAMTDDISIEMSLNDEIEIIEDTPKEDKKIDRVENLNSDYYYEHNSSGGISSEEIILDIRTLKNHINQIIDYLKSKGE